MIEIGRSFIVGAIQGIAEFLPISSSGHLVLVPYIFNWDYKGLAFDVALHFGTVLALIAYFWRDWLALISGALNIRTPNHELRNTRYELRDTNYEIRDTNPEPRNYPDNLLWQILLASIPAAVVGVLISDYVENYLHSPILLAFNLVFFGWLLWFVDKKSKARYEIRSASWRTKYLQSFLIGIAQSVSLVPGVSRSGITMTAGRALGLNRESAARFSFLLGTPAMIGAFVFKFKDIEKTDLNIAFWIGVLSATVFGFIAIKYLLQYLKKSDFSLFFWYRVAIAAIVLMLYFTR